MKDGRAEDNYVTRSRLKGGQQRPGRYSLLPNRYFSVFSLAFISLGKDNALSSNLHFRQFNGNLAILIELAVGNCFQSRQVIGQVIVHRSG